ncbi:glycerophosphodiester phosphodiesterase family protein [Chitinophaga agrisoli]|uniref:Glycerophosphodiester phosphodiesterase family protein n=1 Tax=Chitinophaga agrisoli TaxID=2607653 RepID=A0A5B2VNB5_9BACT|nr:glycerophosphodiester phosphodiesterase family protein [Chitinophaga agrisoli]KAA2239717.1 glycerophosphodiester phosphodiesterase family protein [Chitinophaga agrisoli]
MYIKRFNTIIAAAALLLSVAATATAQQVAAGVDFRTVQELQQFLAYSPKRIPMVSAHRGGPQAGFPENALETFANSIRLQPVIIECDITLSKDSVLVLMHDDRLDRTSTGTGPLRDRTYAELTTLQLKDNQGDTTPYHIPQLDDVLRWGRGKVIFTLDVKRGVPYAMVIDAVHRCHAEACAVIITYNAAQAAEVHQLAPELMISASIRNKEDLERLHTGGVPDNRLLAFVGVSEADPELYRLLHEHGIQCILGVMGNLDRQAAARGPQVYYDLVDRGADILSTDAPVTAAQALEDYIRQHGLPQWKMPEDQKQ